MIFNYFSLHNKYVKKPDEVKQLFDMLDIKMELDEDGDFLEKKPLEIEEAVEKILSSKTIFDGFRKLLNLIEIDVLKDIPGYIKLLLENEAKVKRAYREYQDN